MKNAKNIMIDLKGIRMVKDHGKALCASGHLEDR